MYVCGVCDVCDVQMVAFIVFVGANIPSLVALGCSVPEEAQVLAQSSASV